MDLTTLEVLRHRLWTINEEQSATVVRTSGAPVTYEAKDFNTSILDRNGKSIFVGTYTPQQSMSLDVLVAAVLELGLVLQPGDMLFSNDPWCGVTHQYDGALVRPVFWAGEIVAWTGVALHDSDMGGPEPGINSKALNAHQEAPIIPPVRVIERGEIRPDIEACLVRNVRAPELNKLSLRARIAAVNRATQRLEEVIQEYGLETFLEFQDQWVERVNMAVRARLNDLPDGEWSDEVFLDHDGLAASNLFRIAVTLRKQGASLNLDFTGTDAQAPGPINCAYGGLLGACYSAVLTSLCYGIGWCPAALQPLISIESQIGTINNAAYPGAVGHGTVQAMSATAGVVRGCLSKMFACAPEYAERSQACSSLAATGALLWGQGHDGRLHMTHPSFLVARGNGAFADRDGLDTGGWAGSPGQSIMNVETAEASNPLILVLYRRQHPETAGAGRFRGGMGQEVGVIRRDLGADGPLQFYWGSMGFHHPLPKGLAGGLPASVSGTVVVHECSPTEILEKLATRAGDGHVWDSHATDQVEAKSASLELLEGDMLVFWGEGGAGYGDPLTRDPELVARDVANGFCTEARAERTYGVVFSDGNVAWEETARHRAAARGARVSHGAATGADDGTDQSELHEVGTIDGVIAITEGPSGPSFQCRECGHEYGHDAASIKSAASTEKLRLTGLSELNRFAFADDGIDIELRLYACPGCGLATGTEFRRPGESITTEYDPRFQHDGAAVQ